MGSHVSQTMKMMQSNSAEDNLESFQNNGLIFNDKLIPLEIVCTILTYLDCESLVRSRSVCKVWKFLIEQKIFKIKVREKYCTTLENSSKSVLHKLQWYILCQILKAPFYKNLLLNECGQESLKHWTVILSGGNRWKIEPTPQGSDALPDNELEFACHKSCFATSYMECRKQQIIELKNHGFTNSIMDHLQPEIHVSEWYAGRFDCGCKYELHAHLLDSNKKNY
uniref:F-box domain-containing protein n=1 Tax=Clastoptera arizonana TaxID=38151 RepID=A0A1B6CF02_9HEMI